ncbi:MAG: HisA/HisF-related TIM barrel protein, partial [Acetivibrio sp.]
DGARMGHLINEQALKEILEEINIPIQVGGGIRSMQDVERLLNIGAGKAIIGTKAVGNPAFIKDVITNFGKDKIIVSIDTIDGMIVTNGWEKASSVRAIDHAMEMKKLGVINISYVDASRENHTSFNFIEEIHELYEKTGLHIITRGNRWSLKELEKLEEINVRGVVIEKDVFPGSMDIKSLIEIFNKGEADTYGR